MKQNNFSLHFIIIYKKSINQPNVSHPNTHQQTLNTKRSIFIEQKQKRRQIRITKYQLELLIT